MKAFEFQAGKKEGGVGGAGKRQLEVEPLHLSSLRVFCIIHMPGPALRSDWLLGLAVSRHSATLFANIPHSKPC